MKKYKLPLLFTILLSIAGCFSPYDQVVEIETLGNLMKYNMTQIKAKPNTKIKIILKNNASLEIMKHNIVILNDASKIDEVGTAALNVENYVPKHPSIIAASDMIGPGEETELIVQIPDAVATYPFICTFPGHYQVMQGKIIVE